MTTQAQKKLDQLQAQDNGPFAPDGTYDDTDVDQDAPRLHREAHCLAFTMVVLPGDKDEDGNTADAVWSVTMREGVTEEEFTSLLESMSGAQELLRSYGGRFVTANKLTSVSTMSIPSDGVSGDSTQVTVQTPMAYGPAPATPAQQGAVGIGVQTAAPVDMTPIVFPIQWLEVAESKTGKRYVKLGNDDVSVAKRGVYVEWGVLKAANFQVAKDAAYGKYPLAAGYEAVCSRDKEKPQYADGVVAIRAVA